MKQVLYAVIRRWWHCLTHLHRAETARIDGLIVYLGCECGFTTFGSRETWTALWKRREPKWPKGSSQ